MFSWFISTPPTRVGFVFSSTGKKKFWTNCFKMIYVVFFSFLRVVFCSFPSIGPNLNAHNVFDAEKMWRWFKFLEILCLADFEIDQCRIWCALFCVTWKICYDVVASVQWYIEFDKKQAQTKQENNITGHLSMRKSLKKKNTNLVMLTKMLVKINCYNHKVCLGFFQIWFNYANNLEFHHVFSFFSFFSVWTISFIYFLLHSFSDSFFHCKKIQSVKPSSEHRIQITIYISIEFVHHSL